MNRIKSACPSSGDMAYKPAQNSRKPHDALYNAYHVVFESFEQVCKQCLTGTKRTKPVKWLVYLVAVLYIVYLLPVSYHDYTIDFSLDCVP